ncbi:MAG TPA: alpha/beta hydrolase [Tepidisphaeraceae bacterium]|jgi:hypothetical protein
MFLFIPSNESGVVVDPYMRANLESIEIPEDVFIYSHGWWTSAVDAMISYNRFAAGLNSAAPPAGKYLAIGIHWPSMLSENQRDWINCVESASFFTMEQRAEHVGRHAAADVLRSIFQRIKTGVNLRVHLLGHSFGCKVICAALAEMIATTPRDLWASAQFNLVLLQAAVEDDCLAPQGRYGTISQVPKLRILMTKSSQDTALCAHYPRAHALEWFDHEDRVALGAKGPAPAMLSQFAQPQNMVLNDADMPFARNIPFLVVDLSEIHRRRALGGLFKPRPFAGQHSDIYFPKVYGLLGRFLNSLKVPDGRSD